MGANHTFPFCLSLILAIGWLCGVSQATDKLYLDYGGGEALIEVDVASGDRRAIVVENYPHIISAYLPMPVAPNEVLFYGFTATQRRGIHRVNAVTRIVSPVSGATQDFTFDLLGSGPEIDRPIHASVQPAPGTLIVLLGFRGPMQIDLESGDRRMISQSADPPVGTGYELLQPLDMVESGDGALYIVEQFQGLVRVDLSSGDRSLAVPNTAFTEPPWRLERLRDGRLAHNYPTGDSNTIFAYDLARGVDDVVSSSGGYQRGEGPAFGTIFDITVDDHGMLYAMDIGIGALFMINPKSGDRTIIAGGPENIGEGPQLPDAFAMPRLAARRLANSTDAAWLAPQP